MENISRSVKKKDHEPKVSGRALYVGDYDKGECLIGKLLHSERAHARILNVKLPELPEGCMVVDKSDVTGDNNVNIVKDDTPVFARETVEYIGEPILMVVAPDERTANDILNGIQVEYEDLPPVLDIRDFDTVFFDYEYGKGDVDKAFADADKIYEEEFETGYQEQAYLETQGMIAEPGADR